MQDGAVGSNFFYLISLSKGIDFVDEEKYRAAAEDVILGRFRLSLYNERLASVHQAMRGHKVLFSKAKVLYFVCTTNNYRQSGYSIRPDPQRPRQPHSFFLWLGHSDYRHLWLHYDQPRPDLRRLDLH